jgi:hypothetical protein
VVLTVLKELVALVELGLMEQLVPVERQELLEQVVHQVLVLVHRTSASGLTGTSGSSGTTGTSGFRCKWHIRYYWNIWNSGLNGGTGTSGTSGTNGVNGVVGTLN